MLFKAGDILIYNPINEYKSGNPLVQPGMRCKVLQTHDPYHLEFDSWIGGHSGGNGKGTFGHCWWFPINRVEENFVLESMLGMTNQKHYKVIAKIKRMELKRKKQGYVF